MNVLDKIKNNYKTVLIIGGIILLCLLIGFLLGRSTGENVPGDGESIDTIRSELKQTEGAKQDIADTAGDITSTSTDIAETVGNLADSINAATGASASFDAVLEQCTDIIEQIRSQPAN